MRKSALSENAAGGRYKKKERGRLADGKGEKLSERGGGGTDAPYFPPREPWKGVLAFEEKGDH